MGLKEASESYGEHVIFCYTCEKEIYKSEGVGNDKIKVCSHCYEKIAADAKHKPKGYRKLSESDKKEVKEALGSRT
jgi:ribosomal protein L37AE/L43A